LIFLASFIAALAVFFFPRPIINNPDAALGGILYSREENSERENFEYSDELATKLLEYLSHCYESRTPIPASLRSNFFSEVSIHIFNSNEWVEIYIRGENCYVLRGNKILKHKIYNSAAVRDTIMDMLQLPETET
jgi:hypothetical protein